jgi:4-aminobutyrate aminotransferase
MSWKPGSHGSTYGGNPIASISALATIEVIQNEGILEQAAETGEYILDALTEIQTRHRTIGDVRGRGLMVGIEFVKEKGSKQRNPDVRNRVIQQTFESGLLLLPCGPNSIRMTPPLNISRELTDEGLRIFEDALTKVEG